MDTGDKDKLDELLELTRENNKILRAIHRKAIWGQVGTFIYWMFILGVVGWSYYYVQPYLNQYMNAYQTLLGATNSLNDKANTLDLSSLKDLIQTVK